MPVSLFAQIKIRRGLQADLPDLSNSEMAFATDTGEVFIGAPDYPSLAGLGRSDANPTFPYKNIRIITSSSDQSAFQKYIYTSNGSVLPMTGPSITRPVVRSYSEKFNDIVNFENFRYTTGLSSDVSTDLNRALREVYNGTAESERKILNLNAGIFVCNAETIKIPPYAHIKGEGKNKTFIVHTANSGNSHLLETVDSLYQENYNIGFLSATLPTYIEISDLTLSIPRLMDIIRLYRASHVTFNRVRFLGSSTASSNTAAIVFDRLGTIVDMSFFKFNECNFENLPNIVNSLDEDTNVVTNVKFDKCFSNNIRNGMTIDHEDISHIAWMSSTFSNVTNKLFDLISGEDFSSINNYYDMPTLTSGIYPGSIADTFNNFSSLADKFNLNTNRTWLNNSNTSIIFSNDTNRFTFGNTEFFTTFASNLLQNQTAVTIGPTFAASRYDVLTLDYCIKRNSAIRMGTLRLSHDGTDVFLFDSFDQTNDTGVSFTATMDMVLGEPHMVLRYTTPNDGGSGTLKIDQKAFLT